MAGKVAINGFGRIGRAAFKILVDRQEPLEIVAINDLGAPDDLAHLLKYDSVHGIWDRGLSVAENQLKIGNRSYQCLQVADPSQAPWHELGVDIVLETSGRFRDRDSCQKHLTAGAKKVIVGAPGKGLDGTFVMGVNDEQYDPNTHHMISNASCTTNCLAPVARVLHDNFVIEHGLMTTVHSYTMDQRLLDSLHKDRRRSRASAVSMVPTTTGAAVAVAEVIPELKGKLDGMAIRVPTPNVSLVDLVCRVQEPVSAKTVNQALEQAAAGQLKGILNYVTEPLVSIDFNHCPLSSSVDASLTKVLDARMVKVLSWYDNEWGYSNRLVDLALHVNRFME